MPAFFAALALVFVGRGLSPGQALLPIDNLFLYPPWRAHAPDFGIDLPHNPLIGDAILQNYSWKRFAAESYAAGRLPLWNPYVLGGQPFLAAGQSGSLYPLGVLFYALPLPQAYAAFLGFHLWLAAIFAHWLARLLGADRLGGLVAGVSFGFCGFLVVSFVWPMVVSTAIWLPALLALIELQFPRPIPSQPRRVTLVAAGAVVVAMQFLAGHLEMSLYLLLTAGLYTALRLVRRLWSERHPRALAPALTALAIVALGAALAGVQLVPFAEAIQHNVRGGWSDYGETVGYALPRERLIAFAVPDYFGNPTHHTYLDLLEGRIRSVEHVRPNGEPRTDTEWGGKNYVEGTAYLGILPLLLAPIGLLVRPPPGARTLGFVALASLLLAFGTPAYALLYYGIPGVNQLHTPFRWIYPLSLALAVLAGLGASSVFSAGRPDRPGRGSGAPPQPPQVWGGAPSAHPSRWAAWLGLATRTVGSSLVAALLLSLLSPDIGLSLAERALRRWPDLRGGFGEAQVLLSYQYTNILGTGLLLAASGLILWRASCRRAATAVAAVALLVGDLFSFGIGFNTVAATDALEFVPPSIGTIVTEREPFRVVTYGDDDTLPANTGMIFGLQDVRGYDTILLRDYVAYMDLIEPQRGTQYSKVAKLFEERSLASPLLDLLNARYVLTTRTVSVPHYTLVEERDGVRVYRNERALPRAFVVQGAEPAADHDAARRLVARPAFDPRQSVVLENWDGATRPSRGPALPAEVVEYADERVRIRAAAPSGGFLVLAETFFDGWRARVDGVDRPILRANALLRAVELEPGDHDVLFEYRPTSLRVGAALSAIGALALALLLGLSALGRATRPTDGPHATAGRVFRNSAVPMATGLFNKLVDTAFAVVMIRVLQAEGVGSYTFAGVLIGYLDIVVGFGLGTLLTREVARDPSLAGRFLGNALVLRAGLWVLAAGAVALVVGPGGDLFGITPPLALTLWLLLLGLVPTILSGALSALFAAHERMDRPALVTVLTTLLKVGLGLVALAAGWGYVGLAAVSIVTNVLTLAVLLVDYLRSFGAPRLTFDRETARWMTAASLPLMLNSLLNTAFFRIDVLLLKPLAGAVALGWYSTAYRFIDGLQIIPSSFVLAVFPLLSRHATRNRAELARVAGLSLRVLLSLALPIAVGTTLLAEPIVLLFAGPGFLPESAVALQVLIWYFPFSVANGLLQYVLIALDRQRWIAPAFLLGVAFNVAANLLLIPAYGFLAAAVVTVLSELVLLVPFWLVVRRDLRGLNVLGAAWRPAAASLAMAGPVWALGDWNAVLAIPVGAVTYGLALLLVGGVSAEERAVLLALARRRRNDDGPRAGPSAT